MMEHMRQFDWCDSARDENFIEESDLDDCVVEKILSNRFRDPLLTSSDSEDENLVKPKIKWDLIFGSRTRSDFHNGLYVPGLRPSPLYPKLSSLSEQQHYQCLKVLCSENRNILQGKFIPRPTKQDHKMFEELKNKYIKEQQEYLEWAKTMWSADHCVRALHPKPVVETVYEAEFKMRALQMKSFPKMFELAAQIPLYNRNMEYETTLNNNLTNVDVSKLPEILNVEVINKKIDLLKTYTVPEPCIKHPCRFILPNETSMSILPLIEIHKELAHYALDNGAQYIASEGALKCFVETDRYWTIPLSVVPVIGPDGYSNNVVVLGSEFSTRREIPQTRTYKAYRHLLEFSLTLLSEEINFDEENSSGTMSKGNNGDSFESANGNVNKSANVSASGAIDVASEAINASSEAIDKASEPIDAELNEAMDVSVSDEDEDEDQLFIDTDYISANENVEHEPEKRVSPDKTENEIENNSSSEETTEQISTKNGTCENSVNDIGVYCCMCKDSAYEKPPPRSFSKWRVRNKTNEEKYDFIVHCSHKVRNKTGEVLLEPIPEYQIDLGASQIAPRKIISLALSLALRQNASVLIARIDSVTGELVRTDNISSKEFTTKYGDHMPDISNTIHATIDQLQGLMPGTYVLQHEPCHGSNALLYVARTTGNEKTLSLDFDYTQPLESDEAKSLKAPILTPILLPCHKFRKILPCAFTVFNNQLAKDTKKLSMKNKAPPQAIKWPRKKRKNKKGGQNKGFERRE